MIHNVYKSDKTNYLDWAHHAKVKMRKQVMYITQLDCLSNQFLTQDGCFDINMFENTLRKNLKIEDGYKWAFLVYKEVELHLIVYRQNCIEIELLHKVLDDDRNSNFEYGQKALEYHFIHNAACNDVVTNYNYINTLR